MDSKFRTRLQQAVTLNIPGFAQNVFSTPEMGILVKACRMFKIQVVEPEAMSGLICKAVENCSEEKLAEFYKLLSWMVEGEGYAAKIRSEEPAPYISKTG